MPCSSQCMKGRVCVFSIDTHESDIKPPDALQSHRPKQEAAQTCFRNSVLSVIALRRNDLHVYLQLPIFHRFFYFTQRFAFQLTHISYKGINTECLTSFIAFICFVDILNL